ncbi:hypothetical protein [Rubritalea tangerina]
MFIQHKKPKSRGVIVFTALYLACFLAFAIMTGGYCFLWYFGAQLLLTIGLVVAHRNVGYSRTLLWALSLWGFLNLLGFVDLDSLSVNVPRSSSCVGELWLLTPSINFSNLVHVYGFGVATWVSWQTLCQLIHSRYQRRLMPSFGLLVLVMSSAVGYGALNELVEFYIQLWFLQGAAGSYGAICWDMSAVCLGALLAAISIKLRNL